MPEDTPESGSSPPSGKPETPRSAKEQWLSEEPGVKLGRAIRKRFRHGILTLLPYQIALAPVLGTLLGWWLDKRLETSPWLTLAGLALGLFTAGRAVAQAIKEANR